MAKREISWVKAVERNHPPLFVRFIIGGLKRDLIKAATDLPYEFKNFRKIGLDLYFDVDEMKDLTGKIVNKTNQKGARYLKEHSERCYTQCENFLAKSKEIGTTRNFRGLSTCELRAFFSYYAEQAEKMASYLTTVIACQNALEPIFEERLKELLEKHNATEAFEKYKTDLSIPSKENLLVQNMKELILIASGIQASEEILALFELIRAVLGICKRGIHTKTCGHNRTQTPPWCNSNTH